MWRYTYSDELYHYGIPGMKWGHRKKRDKSSFNTTYRPTGLTKPSGLRGEKIAYTKGHNNITNRKAERIALKEGRAYRKTYKNKANNKDELSVIGNKYDEEVRKASTKRRSLTKGEKKMVKSATAAGVAAARIYTLRQLNNSEFANAAVWAFSKAVTSRGPERGRLGRAAQLADTINKGRDFTTKILESYMVGVALGEIYKINK